MRFRALPVIESHRLARRIHAVHTRRASEDIRNQHLFRLDMPEAGVCADNMSY
jgi:hypothetical protein